MQHDIQASGHWQTLTLLEQLGNVGSEVGRAKNARVRGDEERVQACFVRALDLLDLTLGDARWVTGRREIARAREALCDAVEGGRAYGSTLEDMDRYFFTFALAARAGR